MKKILLSLICFFIAAHSFSQITLGTNDFPKSGKIYNLSTARPFTGMDATLTDTNYTWDYSLLATTRTGAREDTFITVGQTASLYSLYFAAGAHKSNQAITGTNFSLGSFITVTNAFNFFENSTTSYNQTGFGGNVNSIPTPIGYTPEDVVYQYPVNYGNVDSSNSAYVISIPNLIYYGVNMTRTNVVDGWGTLITPYGTFNALRLKSTIVEVDTFYVDTLLHYGTKLPPTTRVEYKWLGAGMGEPLLQIDMTGNAVTSIAYLDSVRSTVGISNIESVPADLNIYPNPAKDQVTVRYKLPAASDVHIEVVDLTGKVIVSSEKKNQSPGDYFFMLELPTLPASSNYFVSLNWNGKQVVKPLTISK